MLTTGSRPTLKAFDSSLALKILLLLAGFACFAVRLDCSYVRAASPFQVDYEEGNILNAASRITHGLTPYPAVGSFPYTVNCYGPIGYLVSAAGIKILGLSFFGPRLLVLFAGIGIVFMIAGLTKALGADPGSRWLAALSFLCAPLVYFWFPVLRVDFWAIFLSLLGLYVAVRLPRAWALTALIFAVALLTKHTAIAAPAAVFIEYLMQRKLRRGVAFAGITAAVVLLCLVLLGRDFVFALLGTHPDPYSFRFALQAYAMAMYGCILPLSVILYALVTGFRWTTTSRLVWFYVGLCTLTSLSAGKLGSNTNHFLEWTTAVCILCGLALAHLFRTQALLARPFAVGLCCLAIIFTLTSQWNWRNMAADQADCPRAYDLLRTSKTDRILSENIGALVLSGKSVLVSNPFVVTQLGNSVGWQAGSMEQLTQDQFFDLVLLGGELNDFRPESGTWSRDFIRVLADKYSAVERFQCPYARVAYIPRTGSSNAGHD